MHGKFFRTTLATTSMAMASLASAEPMYPTNDSPFSSDADVFGNEPYGEFFHGVFDFGATEEDTDAASKVNLTGTSQGLLGVTGLRGLSNVRVTAGFDRTEYKMKFQTGASKDELGDKQTLRFTETRSQFGAALMISEALSLATRFYVPSNDQDYFITSMTWRSNGNHVGLSFEPLRNTTDSPQTISLAYTRAWERLNVSAKAAQVSHGKFEGYKDHLDLTVGSEVKTSDAGTIGLAWNMPGKKVDSRDTFTVFNVAQPYLQARYSHKVSGSMDAALYTTSIPGSSSSETFDGAKRTIKTSGNSIGFLLRKAL